VNAKTPVGGGKYGARLESSMQNVADSLTSRLSMATQTKVDDLATFLLLGDRKKMKSEIKSAPQPGRTPLTTPPSGLYDWNTAMRQLFTECRIIVPAAQSLEEFLRNGPSVLLSIHPAMGPFWDVIAQKISGGRFAEGSEVELEIAELSCKELAVDGSFRLIADTVTGPVKETEGRSFTDKVGRAKLSHLTVINTGVKNRDPRAVLNGTIDRSESCQIRLEGFSELVAEDVTIRGNFHLTVPNGKRAILTQVPSGGVATRFEDISTPGWTYAVEWNSGSDPILTPHEMA
jgi:UTP---glucose-1-phosphate uridylyltransferase